MFLTISKASCKTFKHGYTDSNVYGACVVWLPLCSLYNRFCGKHCVFCDQLEYSPLMHDRCGISSTTHPQVHVTFCDHEPLSDSRAPCKQNT